MERTDGPEAVGVVDMKASLPRRKPGTDPGEGREREEHG
ncbi:hypothetical protein B005_3716 [Nocardiopsis alba ATCC BAA-2165]|uniref:Uncharacterized protein n=1 Tax=Nocardiopsis alba (strain ATCC BAA-2165 / BE74) TaxID=1205910 RepID=J7LCH4_NOCAA|nr:hypothetical protein B005_3716 [Nocardiopsis alba ATCC BAA-2165]